MAVVVAKDGSGGTGAASSYQAASRSLDSLVRGRQAEPPDRMLERYCGRGVTVRRMVQVLGRGFPDVGRVEVTFDPAHGKIEVRFRNRKGREFGVVEFQPSEDPDCLRRWMVELSWVGVPPEMRGRGIGTRLFVNSVRFFAGLGRFSRLQFYAADLGSVTWARFGGIRIKGHSLAQIREALRQLNQKYGLGLSGEAIDRADFDSIRSVQLSGAPAAGLILEIDEIYRRYGSGLSWRRLRRLARRIGLVAILKARFVANLDIRRGSRDYRKFLLSVRRGEFLPRSA